MAANYNDKKYTAADFAQYHSGSMPMAEMYALEKAALEDPFLADALEGYAFTATATEDIQELRKKIPPQKRNKKVVPVVSFKSMWLRIAAILILVGGISYISYISVNKNTQHSFAKLEEPVKMEDTSPPSISNADKIATPQTQSSTQNGTSAENKNSRLDQTQNEKSATFKDQNDVSATRTEAEMQTPVAFYQKKSADDKNKYRLKGQVVNEKGEPVSFANVQTEDKKAVVSADINGKFSMPVSDSITNTSIAALGYTTTKKNLKADEEQKIVLEQKNQTLDEVVVAGYGQTKKKVVTGSVSRVEAKDIANSMAGKVPGVSVVTASQPVIGISKYNKYIADSLKAPVSADQQPQKGIVELSFKVNKEGEPKKIKVEKSLCTECDTEAIRLLKSGPKWTYTNGKRTTTIIKF